MCGIAGFWAPNGLGDSAPTVLARMTAAIRHRGPDDDGCWWDDLVGVALGHRRLSILDLSPEGRQPMASEDGRYIIIYNGEVYNFQDLRHELEARGVRFRGHSDTEIMLAEIQHRGVVPAVQAFSGMFAFVLLDRLENRLHMVRDRIGEKPLYYGWSRDTLVFGSELKALRQHPSWQGEVDREALRLFLQYGYIPAPYSIYRRIRKVVPGTVLTFNLKAADNEPNEIVYWSARETAESSVAAPWSGSEEEFLDALDEVLRDTVSREMIADVPVGAFLSGGVDSSLVVALMQAQSGSPVRTFTIGFDEAEYNEAEYAKSVARYLGTDHVELYVRPGDALAVVPKLPALYDEPLGDSSQIPTFLVSELARQHVTVSLSGDGADELFGGYDRYFLAQRIWMALRFVPREMRRIVARGLRAVPPARWDQALQLVGIAGSSKTARRVTGDRLHRAAGVIAFDSPDDMYRDFVSHWHDARAVVRGGIEPSTALTEPWVPPNGLLAQMMYLDLVTYLPDDVLAKVDRASMGVSLESRAPYLDHRVVQLAWRVSPALKVRHGRGKWPLRQLLCRYVPKALIERPKMGFGVPIDRWLRGPLKNWAAALLEPARLDREGYFEPRLIEQKWAEHQRGSRNWHSLLWDIVMFQAWLEAQRSP